MSHRFRTALRTLLVTVTVVVAGTALAACSAENEESGAETAAEQSHAPVLGDYDDRIQLVEGTPYTLTGEDGSSTVLEVTGHNEEEPSVVLAVTPEGGESEEKVLAHGDVVELDGDSWRVSEMGFGDSVPGSVTLTREE
ncbi:hypothetical protein NI17_013320 [Thermobifida halotolerans]|uniref:Lipoprotein n=1 Tax=Thermobifida halotolerans TaxID=483545 RepID=A0AA97M6F3_9ACTN|nr:hypothetical protein NI17_013320 [Thermobifida halotolerans]